MMATTSTEEGGFPQTNRRRRRYFLTDDGDGDFGKLLLFLPFLLFCVCFFSFVYNYRRCCRFLFNQIRRRSNSATLRSGAKKFRAPFRP